MTWNTTVEASLFIDNLHLDCELRPVRTHLERLDGLLEAERVCDELRDVAKGSGSDEADDDGPRLGVPERGDNVDFSKAHRHEGDLDVGLATPDLQQSAAILERLPISLCQPGAGAAKSE